MLSFQSGRPEPIPTARPPQSFARLRFRRQTGILSGVHFIAKLARGQRLGFWLGTLLTLGVAGCQSSKPAGGEADSGGLLIRGNTPGQISEVAREVFREHGYLAAPAGAYSLVFEKKASKMANFAYGNWIGEEPVWSRVKVRVAPVEEAVCRLECRNFLVRDRGGSTEEEIAVSQSCKPLLLEVARRLGQKPGS